MYARIHTKSVSLREWMDGNVNVVFGLVICVAETHRSEAAHCNAPRTITRDKIFLRVPLSGKFSITILESR